jgi:pilus assembly protein Flp/PilA
MLHYMRARLVCARSERGASAVEYGLLVALIAVAIVAIVGFLGDELQEIFTDTNTAIANR